MTIVIGWLKQTKHMIDDWNSPVLDMNCTVIADSMLSFQNGGGVYSSMHKELKKIISLPLQFGIPNCGLGRIRYFSKYRCHDIGLSMAGSNILSSIIVNEVRDLCADGLVLSISSDAIVKTDDKRAANRHDYADDFAFNEYPILNLDQLAEHVRKIIHAQTAYYCAEHIGEQNFTKKSCQISMFGMCPQEKILKMFEFIPKLDPVSQALQIDLIKHTGDNTIYIHGSANDEVRGEITAMFHAIDNVTITEKTLRDFIIQKITSGAWENQGIGGKAMIATAESTMRRDVRLYQDPGEMEEW